MRLSPARGPLVALFLEVSTLLGTLTPVRSAAPWGGPSPVATVPVEEWVAPWNGFAATFDGQGRLYAAAVTQGSGPDRLRIITEIGSDNVVKGRTALDLAISTIKMSGRTAIRIVWIDREDRTAIWVSRNDSGDWVSSRLWIGTAFDPVIAPLGHGLAVAFVDDSHRLHYLAWDPARGVSGSRVLATACCTGAPAVTTSGGRPVVAYTEARRGSPDRVRLARLGSEWRTTTVDARASRSAAITVDSSGALLVAYQITGGGPAGGDIVLARRGRSGWAKHRVIEDASTPLLAADKTGAVAVAGYRWWDIPDIGGCEYVVFRRVDRSEKVKRLAFTQSAVLGLRRGLGSVAYVLDSGECMDGGLVYLRRQY